MAFYGGEQASGFVDGLYFKDIADPMQVFEIQPGRLDDPAAPNPGSRADAVIRVDELTQVIWLFGGRTDEGIKNDLWRFSLNTFEWTQVSAGTEGDPPPPLLAAGIVISPTDGSVFLIAGTNPGTLDERVWRFHGGAWHRMTEFVMTP
jgi:hypothetical protein